MKALSTITGDLLRGAEAARASGPSKGEIARIHVLKGKAGLEDADYRALLAKHGVETSKNLSAAATRALIAELSGLAGQDGKPRAGFKPAKHGHVRKVYALWTEAHRAGAIANKSRAALTAFVKRMGGPDHPDWLTPKQATPVIEALKKMIARAKSPEPGV